MFRPESFGSRIVALTVCTKFDHWASNPAPPWLVGLVIQSLFWRSSAMLIFQGWVESRLSLIHWSRLQPSGRSPWFERRTNLVASKRRPSAWNSSSQSIAWSEMKSRTSGRP